MLDRALLHVIFEFVGFMFSIPIPSGNLSTGAHLFSFMSLKLRVQGTLWGELCRSVVLLIFFRGNKSGDNFQYCICTLPKGGMYWEIHNWGPRDAKQFYQFLNQNISIKFLSISMGKCTVEDLLLWGPAPVCPLLHSCHYCHFLQPYLRARSQNLGHKLSTAKSQIVNGKIAGPV